MDDCEAKIPQFAPNICGSELMITNWLYICRDLFGCPVSRFLFGFIGFVGFCRDQFEEEQEAHADLQRALTKAQNEAAEWRRKCESGEGGVR